MTDVSTEQAGEEARIDLGQIEVVDLDHRFVIEPIGRARPAPARKGVPQPGGKPNDPDEIPEHIKASVAIVEQDDDLVLLAGPTERLWLPKPLTRVHWFLMNRGFGNQMLFKYQFNGLIEVEDGDFVVDCGAYVGAFALAAAPTARRVVALEPASINHECMRRNVAAAASGTIECQKVGLFNRSGEVVLNVAVDSTDNSLIAVDSADVRQTETIQVLTPADLCAAVGEERIDFLKLEAEGVELEILQDVHPDLVRKIAIDASAERFGQSPLLDIAVLLANRGYRLASRNYWLYAIAQ